MRFTLIDRITGLKAGDEISAVKNVSLAEEYLQDHFPLFPVLPGVFMLEAMTEAAAWLIRFTDDFAHSVVTLKEARNVKYADFVEPGNTLTVTAKIVKHEERMVSLKADGTVDGRPHVSARLVLERYNLSDTNPPDAELDEYSIAEMRKLFDRLYRP
jgi:3-hydroxyacyl-[acyl-carrier-protein] dehydratase